MKVLQYLMGYVIIHALGAVAFGDYTAFPICTDSGTQRDPAISGNLVLWMDERTGMGDIRGYDLASNEEMALTVTASSHEVSPSLRGGAAVWANESIGLGVIEAQRPPGGSTLPITTGEYKDDYPATNGETVVWRRGQNSIYGHNLSTNETFSICTVPGFKHYLDVCRDYVVWEDRRAGGNPYGRIYGYDLTSDTEIPISSMDGDTNCRISGNTVVYQSNRNGNWDIYGFDLQLRSEFPICVSPGDQTAPAVDGDLVVWRDAAAGNGDIWGRWLGTSGSFPISTNAAFEDEPAVFGNTVVWTCDQDIYGAIIPEPATLSLLGVGLGGLLVRRKRK